jgi:hypothetical protein
MRDYGRVYSAFWQSAEARAFSEDGRTLALYLLTSPHANLIGCYRLPDAYAADDLQWALGRVSKGFAELQSKGFASRDEATKWVLIHKYLLWNGFENGNVAIAAHKAFDQVPASGLKSALALALLEFGKHLKEVFVNGLRTLSEPLPKPFANPEPEPEPILNLNQNQNQNPARTIFGAPPLEATPVAPKTAKSPKAEKQPSPTAETWAAYAEAYAMRYAVDPVRNATVNGQLSQLVGRLGAQEAPQVAAWYLTHRNQFYVSAGHAVGILLRDCEKLRTEWATGRQATQTQAIQGDRTQTNANAFAGLLAEANQEAKKEFHHAEH